MEMIKDLVILLSICSVLSISPDSLTCREVKKAYRETICCHPDVPKNTSLNGLCAYGAKTQSGVKVSFAWLRNENVTMEEFHQIVEPVTESGKSLEFI